MVEERMFGSQNAVRGARFDPDDPQGQRLGNGLRVVVLSTSIGLQVIWDGGSYLELSIPPQYKSRVCGLCGTYIRPTLGVSASVIPWSDKLF